MTNQRVVPAADYDAAIEVGAEEIAESQRLRAALRKLLDALDAQFDGMDRSGELLHEAQQAAERLLSGEPGSAVETKHEHGADHGAEQAVEVSGKPGSSHACAEHAPGAEKAV